MAIGSSAVCGSYKKEIQAGIHFWTAHTRTGSSAIAADTFKVAMFTDSATINADTTGYTTGNEVSGTNYTAGGAALGSVTLTLADNSSSVPTAYLDFADTTWSTSTISSAMGALIYNSTLSTAGTGSTTNHAAYPAVAMYDFTTAKSSSAGDFTIQWPANDANNAAIRIA
tara:strand:- start:2042 stop:2551 length:510 start_codon:yes stop_codon:yes gene_type:complete